MTKKGRKPHRFKKRKPIYKNRFFWFFLLGSILLFSLFYFIFFSQFFMIKKINLVGQKEIKEEELFSLIEKKLNDKVLFFSSKNIFLVNLNKIKESLSESFPKIAELKVNRRFPDELNFAISERETKVVLCFLSQEEEKCFASDKKGVIFEEKTKEDIFFPVIKISSFEKEVILGEEIVEEEQITCILEINSELEKFLKIPVKKLILDSPEKLIVLTAENWLLYFNPRENTKWQLTKLDVLLKERISEQERKNLEYIELRFGNFANPKYKEIQDYLEIEINPSSQNDI